MMKKRFIGIVLVLTLAALAPLAAQNRYALVIGNAAYRSLDRLANTVNDAEDIAAALGKLGYQVDLRRNLGIDDFDEAVSDWTARLAANPANEGFFWYAGHGVQLDEGGNYLIPVDFPKIEDRPENRSRIVRAAYALNDLLAALDRTRNRANMVVLDACRNNPLGAGRGGATSRGLSMVVNTPPDLIIMYSTAAGNTADDGAVGKRNSPFAEAFLKHITKPDPVTLVMADITGETLALTANRQRPYQAGTIVNRNYSLNPAAAFAATAAPVARPAVPGVSGAAGTSSVQVTSAATENIAPIGSIPENLRGPELWYQECARVLSDYKFWRKLNPKKNIKHFFALEKDPYGNNMSKKEWENIQHDFEIFKKDPRYAPWLAKKEFTGFEGPEDYDAFCVRIAREYSEWLKELKKHPNFKPGDEDKHLSKFLEFERMDQGQLIDVLSSSKSLETLQLIRNAGNVR